MLNRKRPPNLLQAVVIPTRSPLPENIPLPPPDALEILLWVGLSYEASYEIVTSFDANAAAATSIGELCDFVAYYVESREVRNSYDSTSEFYAQLLRCGLQPEIAESYIDALFEDVRRTQTPAYWMLESIESDLWSIESQFPGIIVKRRRLKRHSF